MTLSCRLSGRPGTRLRPASWQAAVVVAALALGLCGGSPRPSGAVEVPDVVAQWPAITDQPALTDDAIARFIKANDVAEHLRRQAQERYIEEMPSYAHPQRAGSDPLAGVDFRTAVDGWKRLTAGIEADACSRAGVSYDEYRSVYKRLLQVNELIELQVQIGAKREAVGKLAQRDLGAVAQEQFRAQRQLEQRETRNAIARLEARRAQLVQRRKERRTRERQQAARRLERIPDEEQRLHIRIGQLRQLTEREQAILDAQAGALTQRRDAEAKGWVDPSADSEAEARQVRESVESKIARLDAEIARAEEQLAQLATERRALAAARAHRPPTPAPSEEERRLAGQINEQTQRLKALDEQINHGATPEELAPLVARLQARLRAEVQALAELEKRMDSATMRQAQRDAPVVLPHASELRAYGSAIIFEPPPVTKPRR